MKVCVSLDSAFLDQSGSFFLQGHKDRSVAGQDGGEK